MKKRHKTHFIVTLTLQSLPDAGNVIHKQKIKCVGEKGIMQLIQLNIFSSKGSWECVFDFRLASSSSKGRQHTSCSWFKKENDSNGRN